MRLALLLRRLSYVFFASNILFWGMFFAGSYALAIIGGDWPRWLLDFFFFGGGYACAMILLGLSQVAYQYAVPATSGGAARVIALCFAWLLIVVSIVFFGVAYIGTLFMSSLNTGSFFSTAIVTLAGPLLSLFTFVFLFYVWNLDKRVVPPNQTFQAPPAKRRLVRMVVLSILLLLGVVSLLYSPIGGFLSRTPAKNLPYSGAELDALVRDGVLTSHAETLQQALLYYYGEHKTYPDSLQILMDERGVMILAGGAIDYDMPSVFNGVNYTRSPNAQHFVLSVHQELSKDLHRSTQRNYPDSTEVVGEHYGINCSDQYIFCVTDGF